MIPVILSGGSGSRLWPMSRRNRPKQYIPVVGDQTPFQATDIITIGLYSL